MGKNKSKPKFHYVPYELKWAKPNIEAIDKNGYLQHLPYRLILEIPPEFRHLTFEQSKKLYQDVLSYESYCMKLENDGLFVSTKTEWIIRYVKTKKSSK